MNTPDAHRSAPLPEVTYRFLSPAGAAWRVLHVHHREALSALYECALVLASPQPDASPEDLFDTPAGLDIRRGPLTRRVRGYVRRVEDLGTTAGHRLARVLVVPSLWLLSQRSDARIFQHLNAVEIVREVLRDAGLYQAGGALVVGGAAVSALPREYCVQYNETDLAFVMRLLEDEGIPFHFRHDEAHETLVLAGEGHPWPACATLDGDPVEVADQGLATAATETVQHFDWHRETRPTGVMLRDFDFTHPRATLDVAPRHPQDTGPRTLYEHAADFAFTGYDEHGQHAFRGHDGARRARVRHEAQRATERVGRGHGNVAGFAPGATFDLAGHVRPELDQRYLLTAVEHTGVAWSDVADDLRQSERLARLVPSGEARYSNGFDCVPAGVAWRPPRTTQRPVVQGPQTALVVAEPGSSDEICTDHHGRVLVRFHWDRPERRPPSQQGRRDSCWVRVAQSWAGAGWGSLFIPRVGMEVVVTFLEGNPDRPLVVGCVYNGENGPPCPLPEQKTRTTLKTSSSPGGGGYNELRFEDQTGREHVFLHAQRDHDVVVRNDHSLAVGRNRTTTVQGVEHVTVRRDRITAVERNDALEVEGSQSVAVHGPRGASLQVDAGYHINVDGGLTITCGNSRITVTRDEVAITSPTIRMYGGPLVDIKGTLVKINCSDGATAPGARRSLARVARAAARRVAATSAPRRAAGRGAAALARRLPSLLGAQGLPVATRDALAAAVAPVLDGRAAAPSAVPDHALAAAASAVRGALRPVLEGAQARASAAHRGLARELLDRSTAAATSWTRLGAGLRTTITRELPRLAETAHELAFRLAWTGARQDLQDHADRHATRDHDVPAVDLAARATYAGLAAGYREATGHEPLQPAPGTTTANRAHPLRAPVQGAPAARDAATYARVLDQFVVEANPRYAVDGKQTWCNIFVWDATSAMGAEIPHWVDGRGRPLVLDPRTGRLRVRDDPTATVEGPRELNANATNDWLHQHGEEHGWRRVSAEAAQTRANEGRPVVASWKNPRGIGHIGMVRPGEATARGPALAQAGARNFSSGHVQDGFGGNTPEYWAHD